MDITIKRGYWTRLAAFTDVKELKAILPRIDRLGLTDQVVNKVGAMPLLRIKQLSQTQQIDLYNDIKSALVDITTQTKGGLHA